MGLAFWHVYYKLFYPFLFGLLAFESNYYGLSTFAAVFAASALIAIYKLMPKQKLQGN